MRHKHAELIKAWADGAEIERELNTGRWVADPKPNWFDHINYRLKPEVKPPVVRWKWAFKDLDNNWHESSQFMTDKEAKEILYEFEEYFSLLYTRTEFPV